MSEVDAQPPRPSTARLSAPPMAALIDQARPRAVTIAFWCWMIGGLMAAVSSALGALRLEPMRVEFVRLARDTDPAASADTIDQVAMASVLVVLGTGALVGVFAVLLAGAVRAGRNWARVLLVVVALIAFVHTAFVASSVTSAMLGDLRGPVIGGLLGSTALILCGTVSVFVGTKAWFRRPVGADGR